MWSLLDGVELCSGESTRDWCGIQHPWLLVSHVFSLDVVWRVPARLSRLKGLLERPLSRRAPNRGGRDQSPEAGQVETVAVACAECRGSRAVMIRSPLMKRDGQGGLPDDAGRGVDTGGVLTSVWNMQPGTHPPACAFPTRNSSSQCLRDSFWHG